MKNRVLYGVLIIVLLIGILMWARAAGDFRSASSPTSLATSSTVGQIDATSSVANSPQSAAAAHKTTQSGAQSSRTFHTIFTQSGNHECDYDSVTATGRTSDRVYISGGKMRGEFRTVAGVSAHATMMVFDGYYLYTWTEGTTHGIRSDLTSVSQLPVAIPGDLMSGAVLGAGTNSVGWNCHPWIKDAALLMPPSYVTFSS
jgi:hypothetical protein